MWKLTSLENDVIHGDRRCNVVLRLKDVTIKCKRMRRSLSIGGSSSVQWRNVGRSWRLWMCFRCLLCVRIEIDQLQCVNCWVITHCLSVSCTKINHSRCALVIWSSLQVTSKQWIITQQFTAGADLFLKYYLSIHCHNQVFVTWRSVYKSSLKQPYPQGTDLTSRSCTLETRQFRQQQPFAFMSVQSWFISQYVL